MGFDHQRWFVPAIPAAAMDIPLPDNIEYSTIITDSKERSSLPHLLTKDEKWRMKTTSEKYLLCGRPLLKGRSLLLFPSRRKPAGIGRAMARTYSA